MPLSFSTDAWAKVKGGHIPMGMLASLRSQAFDKNSFVHQSDGEKAGEYVAGKLDDQAKNGKPGDRVDPEAVALMDQMKGDKAFVQALLTDLGPGGAAFLNMRVRDLCESTSQDGGREQGQKLIATLTDVYATGSKVQVTTADGLNRPLMDKEWLDNFNPEKYGAQGDVYATRFADSWYVHGYHPDLLLPFMNQAPGKDQPPLFSSGFSQLVSQRALEDYDKYANPGKGNWSSDSALLLYRGDLTRPGDSKNPFRTDLFHVALERAAEHPVASNALMTGHRDTMLQLMTGKADWLAGGDGPNWGTKALATILTQATTGSQGSDMVGADTALWGVGDYLNKHPGKPMVKNVQVALGQVVTDERFRDGAMNSVTSPFGQVEGLRDDPNHPELGPLMPSALWAALHKEAMRQPDTAAKIIRDVGTYINDRNKLAVDRGRGWDQSVGHGKGDWVHDDQLTSMYRYESETALHFLGTNLKATRDDIKTELEHALEQKGKGKEQAENILGMLLGFATAPSSIPAAVGSIPGAVGGDLTGLAVGKVVDWAMPTGDLTKSYGDQLKKQDEMLATYGGKSGFWGTIDVASTELIEAIVTHQGNTTAEMLEPGSDPSHKGTPRTYSGDPRTYAGHASYSSANASPQTDDFLEYSQDGVPTKVKEFGEMNSAQREAYTKWLHDPAVQKYFGPRYTGVGAIRGYASP